MMGLDRQEEDYCRQLGIFDLRRRGEQTSRKGIPCGQGSTNVGIWMDKRASGPGRTVEVQVGMQFTAGA